MVTSNILCLALLVSPVLFWDLFVSPGPFGSAAFLSRRQHGSAKASHHTPIGNSIAFLGPGASNSLIIRGRQEPCQGGVVGEVSPYGPKRYQSIASQKHVLEKERYIRREAPKGFGTPKATTPEPSSNKGKEIEQEFKRTYPQATLKQLWELYDYTGSIRKGLVSGRLLPAKGVARPNYYKTGLPTYVEYQGTTEHRSGDDPRGTIKNSSEIEGIRKACLLAREILDSVKPLIVEGVFTDDIDRLVHRMCRIKGVFPSPLNYHGFPKSVCTSINEIACHGIPDSTMLSAGDLINVDVTIYADGFHGDVSETFMVLPAHDPKKLANRWTEIGMYERNKMRYHASMHDNISDSGPTILTQLNMMRLFDEALRRLGPKDGWQELFEKMGQDDTDRKPLFLSRKDNDLKRIGSKLASDIEPLYMTDSEDNRYDGRIVGMLSSALPTYVKNHANIRRFMALESPEVLRPIFQKLDPDRRSKPYLFSHTFEEDVELMRVTYEALMKAISICSPGVKISKIGQVIREYVENFGLHSMPNLVGHGIGRNFHENPMIHHTDNDSDVVMEPGMVFTIEPIVTRSKEMECITWPDGWTMATKDGAKTAQFEHTILITENGHEVLTKRLPSSPKLYWEDPIAVKY